MPNPSSLPINGMGNPTNFPPDFGNVSQNSPMFSQYGAQGSPGLPSYMMPDQIPAGPIANLPSQIGAGPIAGPLANGADNLGLSGLTSEAANVIPASTATAATATGL